MSPERVLVTGASGFVGRHTLEPLRAAGLEVHAVSRRGAGEAAPGVRWHAIDLLEPPATADLLATVRPQLLLHLAWYAEHGLYWAAPENLDWVAASAGLLRGFADAGGRRVVVAGTCAEYDWRDPEVAAAPIGEHRTPLNPHSLYGTAKHALGQLARAWGVTADVEVVWGRIFFLYGMGEHPRRLVASIARHLAAGRPAPCSSGEQVRDFLHVEDAGAAFAALVLSEVVGEVNVGSGTPLAIRDLALRLGALAGRPDLVRLGALPTPSDEPPRLVADVTRLRDQVGFTPSRGLDDGLAEVLTTAGLRSPDAAASSNHEAH